MREYVGTAFNHLISIDADDGSLKPMVEMIMLSKAAHWTADAGGYHPVLQIEEHRTTIGSDGLRQAANALLKQAEILERIATDKPDFRFSVLAKGG